MCQDKRRWLEPLKGAGGYKRGHTGRQGSKDASNGATKWRLVILQLHKRGPFRCSCLHPHQKIGTQGRKRENGVLQSENSSSPRSGFNYREQPFLLLLFPSWKGAHQQAATQVKGSIVSSREGNRQWRGDSLQRHTYIYTRTHTCLLQRCRLPHGLAGLLKEAAAPFPLSEMLDTFPLSQP